MRTQVFGQSGDRFNFPNYAVVITDGQPTVNVDQLPGEIQNVQSSGIKVYVVGVTNQVNEATLQSISSAPHQVNPDMVSNVVLPLKHRRMEGLLL